MMNDMECMSVAKELNDKQEHFKGMEMARRRKKELHRAAVAAKKQDDTDYSKMTHEESVVVGKQIVAQYKKKAVERKAMSVKRGEGDTKEDAEDMDMEL